jgi:ABC-2 type transport system permease protein
MINRNLFWKECRMNAPGLAVWILVICFFVGFTMGFYRLFVENQSQFMGLFNLFPQGMFEFKGISNFDDLFSVLGYYAANNTVYMQLFGSIYAIVLASNILLKEEYNKTADYLLSWPLTRNEIFRTKCTVLVLNIIILNLIVALTGFLSIELVRTGPYSIEAYVILSFYTLLLNLFFGFAGLFLSMLLKRARPITTLCIGIVLFMYFIFTLSKITPDVEKLGYISPYRYVDTNVLQRDYGLNLWYILYFTGLSAILLIAAFLRYRKKDIYV